jgi:HlyD family secretion protein
MAKKIFPLILVLAIVGYFGFRAWQKNQADKRENRFYSTAEVDELVVSAQVAGKIVELPAEEGKTVSPGDLLARIDNTPYQAQLNQAEAALAAVDANLEGLEDNLVRTDKLRKSGSATEMQYDTLKAQTQALRAQKRAAAAQVELARTQFSYTRVMAPVTGTVLRVDVNKGETAFPGSSLLALADLSVMDVKVFVPEPMLGKIRIDQKVEIFSDSFPGRPFPGRVAWISPEAEFTPKNIQTREERTRLVYQVKVRVPNPDGIFKIGMPLDAIFVKE